MGDLGGVTQVKVNFDSENKCVLQNNYIKFQPFGRGWRQLAAGGWPRLAAVAEMCQKCEKNKKNIGAGPVAPVHGLVGSEVEVRGSRARELPYFRGAFVAARFSKFAQARNMEKMWKKYKNYI